MKATIQVTVTYTFKTSGENQDELDKLRETIHEAIAGDYGSCGPMHIRGKHISAPEVQVASGIPFVEFNW